jgi:hypothetical protein
VNKFAYHQVQNILWIAWLQLDEEVRSHLTGSVRRKANERHHVLLYHKALRVRNKILRAMEHVSRVFLNRVEE